MLSRQPQLAVGAQELNVAGPHMHARHPHSDYPDAATRVQGPAAGDLHPEQYPGYGLHPGAGMYQQSYGHPQGFYDAQNYAQRMYYGPGMPPHPGMPIVGGSAYNAATRATVPVNIQPDPHAGIGGPAQGGPAVKDGPPGVMAVAGVPHEGMATINRSSFVGSAGEGQNSSLIASTATLTTSNVTKMTCQWTDFQRCGMHDILLCHRCPVLSQCWFSFSKHDAQYVGPGM